MEVWLQAVMAIAQDGLMVADATIRDTAAALESASAAHATPIN